MSSHPQTRRPGKILRFFSKKDPLNIQPYRGYANKEGVFLKGRVLEDEGIVTGNTVGAFRNLINFFKRFESDEIPGAKIGIRLAGNYFETIADKEGYFTLKAAWQQPPPLPATTWLKATAQLLEIPGRVTPSVSAVAEISYPPPSINLGIISDIDDTILQTYVTSMLWWKLIYVTIFKNAHQRLPVPGMVHLMQALAGSDQNHPSRPVFYVSDSPWNIYDLLTEFFRLNQLPKGPIMLRDYGIFPTSHPKAYRGHKLHTISQILDTYPDMRFIMLGDTASKDADIYLTLAEEYPGRIETVYIRYLRNTSNARRIVRLMEECKHVDAVLIRKTQEIFEHAINKGHLAT